MDFYAVLDQVLALLRQRGRVSYRALKLQFHLDDEAVEALKEELLYAQHPVTDEDGRGLVWTGTATAPPEPVLPAPYPPQPSALSRCVGRGAGPPSTVTMGEWEGGEGQSAASAGCGRSTRAFNR